MTRAVRCRSPFVPVVMLRACLLLFACLLLLPLPATAQKLIQGRVTDAETGESLPAANIRVEGTMHGTITNADGAYALWVPQLPATVVVRYIGFETREVAVTAASPERLDVALRPVTYQMHEVVVTDENPALGIMRCVLEAKQQWRATLERYEAEAYTRFTLANDTGVVSIIESLSDVYWDHERGMREVVKSRRQTSNLDLDEYLPAAQFVTNFYDDEIEIAGYTFPGVTHPDAFDHYYFGLEDTRYLDDQLVYDITVRPRNRLKTAFTGRLAVLADACALLEVELTPGEAFLFPPPIEQFHVTYHQQFSDFGKDVWLPVDLRAEIALRVAFNRLLSFPTFRIAQVSRLTNYDVNVVLPDTLYATDDYLQVDTLAVEADTLLDRAGAVVPLDAREVTAYAAIDSTMTLARAYAPTGPLARFIETESTDSSMTVRAGGGGAAQGGGLPFDLSYAPRLWFNRVEALHAGVAVTLGIERLDLTAEGGYSSALHARAPWSYGGTARLHLGKKRRGTVEAGYTYGVVPRYETPLYPRLFTSAYQLLGGGDYLDYYRTERATARAGYRLPKTDLALAVGVTRESPSPVARHTDYDLLGRPELLPANPVVPLGNITSATVTATLGDLQQNFGFTGGNGLRLTVERGHVDALHEDDYTFTRLTLEADGRLPTFFRRRLLPNVLDVRVTAGTYAGRLPLPRYGIVDAALGPYRPFGALRTREGRPYEGARHAALLWEHNFRTVPFELAGLYGLARRGYSVILTGGHARTWIPDDAAALHLAATPGTHHEVGLALSGLFSLLRLDAALRLDAPGFTLGVSTARLF